MTDLELREKAFALGDLMHDMNVSDDIILAEIDKLPELLHAKHKTGMNPFMTAVCCGRISLAQVLRDMGADIHWECAAAEGNALNIAGTPGQADAVLAMGVEIEKNLLLSKPFKNPAVTAALHNNAAMLRYWLKKQRELFADTPDYVGEIFYAAMDAVSMMNQYNMLSCVIADDELFGILKEIYARADNEKSIRLSLSALRHISDKNLEDRKKELRQTLNGRKKALSSAV